MPKVLITRQIPEKGMQILKESDIECDLRETGRPLARKELLEAVRDADAIIPMLYDRVDPELLDQASRLKIAANLAVGTDNIDIPACTERGVAVTNTPGVLTEATAEITFALILAAARHIVPADGYMRKGHFNGWDPMLFVGAELSGKTLGIIGLGRIGQAVARRALGFGMRIIYYNRSRLPGELAESLTATCRSLDQVIQEADFLTLHLPYYPEVHYLINKERLAMMKPGAYLINTARGAHIDEKGLVEHLKAGKIAGAALDVYEHEPTMAPGLADLDNVTILPHLGSATDKARSAMAAIAAQSVADIFTGKMPEHILNPEVFKES
ncbi:MAG: D-glycerate dehydrogenase [Bacillota bacterium]